MNQKDLIKYGLLALGAYLVYQYIQEHGGFTGFLDNLTGGTGPDPKAVSDAEAKAIKAAADAAADPANPNKKAEAEKAAAEVEKVKATPKQVVCWNGAYVENLSQCPAQPAPSTGKTAEQLAKETAQAAKTDLYNRLVSAGVDGSLAQTYIDHCGANGACDQTFLLQMYHQAANGNPAMMRLTDVGGILFNADQWQYYRKEGGGGEVDIDALFPDRTARIHASDFNAAINRGGMGMFVPSGRFTPHWLM